MDYHPIRDTDFIDRGKSDPQITVCVRKRPMNKKEVDIKEVDIVSIPDKQRIIVHEPKLKVNDKFYPGCMQMTRGKHSHFPYTDNLGGLDQIFGKPAISL